jgi:hypothetical protein
METTEQVPEPERPTAEQETAQEGSSDAAPALAEPVSEGKEVSAKPVEDTSKEEGTTCCAGIAASDTNPENYLPTSPAEAHTGIAPGSVKSSVTGCETRSDGITYYNIKSEKDEERYECSHRYNEFVKLHAELRGRFSKVAEYNLPPKAYFWTHTQSTKDFRQEEFDKFLNVITNLAPEMPREAADFLKLNEPVVSIGLVVIAI